MSETSYGEKHLVDENQTRIYAGLVFFMILTYFVTENSIVLYLLLGDMFVNAYISVEHSPLSMTSKLIIKVSVLEEKLVAIESKKFASYIGVNLLLGIVILNLLGYEVASLSLLLVFTFWKLIEVTQNICFVCCFFNLLKRKNIILESL
ncbi:MAG: hypothetical protein SPLUMA1_SPLUMAMAG1_00151 [uncultured Sulfurimonas sp.]|nr:MAG: hypothetical protein SPLUMA1_SPLUMAMAG1_00151 [uncultured Sulfurimonas sp.]